jgi:integrase
VVHWNLLLGKREDRQLCNDAMTAAYAGMAWESFFSSRTLGEVYGDFPSDSDAVADIRRFFEERGAFPTDEESRQVSRKACDDARVMVAENKKNIRSFGWFLCSKGELSKAQIDRWFERAMITRWALGCLGRAVCHFEHLQGINKD